MSRWKHLERVLKEITERMIDTGLTPRERLWYSDLHNRLLWHEVDVEDALIEAKQPGLRNPVIPDDLVGWQDDDFDYPEDEDEDDE